MKRAKSTTIERVFMFSMMTYCSNDIEVAQASNSVEAENIHNFARNTNSVSTQNFSGESTTIRFTLFMGTREIQRKEDQQDHIRPPDTFDN